VDYTNRSYLHNFTIDLSKEEENLEGWDIPALLFTATKDIAFKKKVADIFHEILPNSNEPIAIEAGYYCQEDGNGEIFPPLMDLLSKNR
jgi:hypothetical protein